MAKCKRRALTPQQKVLIEKFLESGTQREAALAAGYTESGAANIWRTFKLPQVAEEYQRRLDDEMTTAEVLHRLGKHAREGEPQISIKALELLGKKHKLFTDKVEASGPDGQPISVVFNLSPEPPKQ